MSTSNSASQPWPALPYEDWKETQTTLQLWLQIVGKVRLRKMPWTNHSWHVTFYVSSQGLTTGSMPATQGLFQVDFNFLEHQLQITTSWGEHAAVALYARSVASFYHEVFGALRSVGIEAYIHAAPNEIEPAIPFAQDTVHQSYDAEYARRFWQVLTRVYPVFTRFRAGFVGKSSPVHLFWGAMDLALTRFSGRPAPLHPGGAPNIPLAVMQEAYSHEVSSCGFWPGNEAYPHPAFYAYSYPAPAGYGQQPVTPPEAFYSPDLGEFILPYEAVRQALQPEQVLLAFLHSTYEAAARTGQWDRALEADFSALEK